MKNNLNEEYLLEVNIAKHIQKSKEGQLYSPNNRAKGKNRHQRRTHQRASASMSTYNRLNADKLFRKDIIDVVIQVQGETDTYYVKLSFSGIMKNLQHILKDKDDFELKDILRAVTAAFNREDVYFHCTCDDFKFRHSWWSIKNGTNSAAASDKKRLSGFKDGGKPQYDWTNKNDTMGGCCKHIANVLVKTGWIRKIGSVIRNYARYMEVHDEKAYMYVIYPAMFGREYPEIQLDIYDLENDPRKRKLSRSRKTIDTANKWAATKNRFKTDKEYGIEKDNEEDDDIEGQQSFDFDSMEDEENEE